MKAAVMHGPKDLRLENVKVPAIQKNEVLVKVKASGVCGSDIHTYKSGAIVPFGRPMILGHEFSGEIAEVGPEVKGLKEGDKVLGTGVRSCGKCYWCQQLQPNRCPNIGLPGYKLDGGFAEYVVVPNPGKRFFKLPENLSWEEGATVEPVSVACFAVEQAGIQPNQAVVVLGAGMIGQGVAQAAKAMGAGKVVVSEPSAKRLAMAKKLGADIALNPREANVVEVVVEATAGDTAVTVFECSGKPVAFHQALQMVKRLGKVIQIARFEEKIAVDPELLNEFTTKNATVRGCSGQAWETALELVRSGKVKTRELITHEFSLDKVKEAFETQSDSDEAIKVIIKP